ncbi:predicted protein [Sclerotinia sclerotiorum 1980 UF-70]|uniref:Transmembrane protein n=1 Tax=Sclerotinia sclerotiorum (strain ATCC 18683 / 1980 / Ss-1) TaxID=665079 RepID=A7F3D7_SCLS1|nr:predicted protein [Sclerotinia sclerotiorum 1980 UF-70]EDN97258.1 predicted protein [Sclerotinia sclerotiorum 1980 UF-70]
MVVAVEHGEALMSRYSTCDVDGCFVLILILVFIFIYVLGEGGRFGDVGGVVGQGSCSVWRSMENYRLKGFRLFWI